MSTTAEAAPTLHYFKGPNSRGALCHLLFAFYEIGYNENLIEVSEWTTKKENYPFRVLPCLAVDGNLIGEIPAIAQYIASLGGYGAQHDLMTRFRVNELVSSMTFFMNSYVSMFEHRFLDALIHGTELNTELSETEVTFFKETVGPFFQCLESRVGPNGCFIDEADGLPEIMAFWVYEIVRLSFPKYFDTSSLNALNTLATRIESNSKIPDYLTNRSPLPF